MAISRNGMRFNGDQIDEETDVASLNGYLELAREIFNPTKHFKDYHPILGDYKPRKDKKISKRARSGYYHWYYKNITKKDPIKYQRHLERSKQGARRIRFKLKELVNKITQ